MSKKNKTKPEPCMLRYAENLINNSQNKEGIKGN